MSAVTSVFSQLPDRSVACGSVVQYAKLGVGVILLEKTELGSEVSCILDQGNTVGPDSSFLSPYQ